MSDNPSTVSPATAAVASALFARNGGHHGPAAEVATLGQSTVVRLLSAGLDLNVALTEAGDSAVAPQLRRAIGEIDLAVGDLRQLMLVVPEAVADTHADGAALRPEGTWVDQDSDPGTRSRAGAG